jgi:hypothetical protein
LTSKRSNFRSTGILAIFSSMGLVEVHAKNAMKHPNKIRIDKNDRFSTFIVALYFLSREKFLIFIQSYMQKIE